MGYQGDKLTQAPPQIFEELSAIIIPSASGLPVAPSTFPKAHFRPPGKHSDHALTSILDPGKVVPVQNPDGNEDSCADLESRV